MVIGVKGCYVSRAMAAELLGMSEHGVDGLIKRGELPVARPGIRCRRSLHRRDVHRVLRLRESTQEERDRQSHERQLRSEARATYSGDEWMSSSEVAQLLGCTPTWVRRLAGRDRLPHEMVGEEFRLRRNHMRLIANARQAARTRLDA